RAASTPHSEPRFLTPAGAGGIVLALMGSSLAATIASAQEQPQQPSAPAQSPQSPAPPPAARAPAVPQAPESIGALLDEARAHPAGLFPYSPVSLIAPAWGELNRGTEELGLKIGLAYTTAYQATTDGRAGSGGDVDLFASWRLLGGE